MTSQGWSCIDYLIPTYSTLALLLRTFFDKNVDYLTSLNKISFVKTYTIFCNLCDFRNTMASQGSAATSLRYMMGHTMLIL